MNDREENTPCHEKVWNFDENHAQQRRSEDTETTRGQERVNGLWRKDVLVLLETPVRGDVDSVGFVVCREISPPGMLPEPGEEQRHNPKATTHKKQKSGSKAHQYL